MRPGKSSEGAPKRKKRRWTEKRRKEEKQGRLAGEKGRKTKSAYDE